MKVKELVALIEQMNGLTAYNCNPISSVETDNIAVREYGDSVTEWFAKSATPETLVPINMNDLCRLQGLLDLPSKREYEILKERLEDEY